MKSMIMNWDKIEECIHLIIFQIVQEEQLVLNLVATQEHQALVLTMDYTRKTHLWLRSNKEKREMKLINNYKNSRNAYKSKDRQQLVLQKRSDLSLPI